MASALQNLSRYDETNIPDARDMRFGIVVAEWNHHITHALYEACAQTLDKHGAREIVTIQVPGSFELPTGATLLIHNHKLDAVICIGCVIKGETSHNEYINYAVANGITSLAIQTHVPVVFGVLTPDNEQQALDRAGGKYGNKGVEAAVTAIRMAAIKRSLSAPGRIMGF